MLNYFFIKIKPDAYLNSVLGTWVQIVRQIILAVLVLQ